MEWKRVALWLSSPVPGAFDILVFPAREREALMTFEETWFGHVEILATSTSSF